MSPKSFPFNRETQDLIVSNVLYVLHRYTDHRIIKRGFNQWVLKEAFPKILQASRIPQFRVEADNARKLGGLGTEIGLLYPPFVVSRMYPTSTEESATLGVITECSELLSIIKSQMEGKDKYTEQDWIWELGDLLFYLTALQEREEWDRT